MIIKREIGEKGQIVIPKDIRDFLGLEKGEKVVFEVKDKEVILKKEQDTEQFLNDFFSIARHKKGGKNLSIKDIKKISGEQYELH